MAVVMLLTPELANNRPAIVPDISRERVHACVRLCVCMGVRVHGGYAVDDQQTSHPVICPALS